MMKIVDRAATFMAIVAGLVLSAVVALVFVDVILRYFFDAPWRGRQDVVEMGMVVSILLAAPYTWRVRDHISVDLLPGMPILMLERLRSLSVRLLTAAIFALVAWRAWHAAEDAELFNEATNMIAIPHQPFIYLIMVVAALHGVMIVLECFLDMDDDARDRDDA